ncbi:MAG TPA: histidine phosphatase family protein [Flavisolibacter sp.]|nr:histidine phosphatase family protein [Flavisolibacter sp.]
MRKIILLFAVLGLLSCNVTTYYIVRHAEKETSNTMTSDVPLSTAGKERAVELKNRLRNENIRYIFSTNYNRTISTAEPTRQFFNTTITLYNTADTMDEFIRHLRKITDGNVLIIGHSNTVDDIVNRLSGENYIKRDLSDSEYGDLFIVKKRGSHYSFKKDHFGNN